jgi:hypothetical protein
MFTWRHWGTTKISLQSVSGFIFKLDIFQVLNTMSLVIAYVIWYIFVLNEMYICHYWVEKCDIGLRVSLCMCLLWQWTIISVIALYSTYKCKGCLSGRTRGAQPTCTGAGGQNSISFLCEVIALYVIMGYERRDRSKLSPQFCQKYWFQCRFSFVCLITLRGYLKGFIFWDIKQCFGSYIFGLNCKICSVKYLLRLYN